LVFLGVLEGDGGGGGGGGEGVETNKGVGDGGFLPFNTVGMNGQEQ
jgi:hypothetical protein